MNVSVCILRMDQSNPNFRYVSDTERWKHQLNFLSPYTNTNTWALYWLILIEHRLFLEMRMKLRIVLQ